MRRIVVLAVLIGGLLAAPAHAVTLHRCGKAVCGTIKRPLDPRNPAARKIDVFFRLYRAAHRRGPAIVAVEGGPGYPSTGSKSEYLRIFGPLLGRRDLLMVDQRGTGRSALIDCDSVQPFAGRTSGPRFALRARRCAREIGSPGLFATAYAVDDLAAVIRALGLGKVDLYGDSYGSWFAQDFVARHPRLIHSLILDSTYPRRDLDPWYRSSAATMRNALEVVSPGSVDRLAELLARVRVRPPRGDTLDSDGTPLKGVTIAPRVLSDLVQDAGSDPLIYRELDASVRAALAGDDVPLLRLAGQSNTWNHSPGEAGYFSRGQYLAVNCTDLPRTHGPAPDVFAPFSPAEWTSVSGFTQPYDVCSKWPRTRRPPSLPERRLPASVPVLITGGDLDSLTPIADAPEIARAVGGTTTIVTLHHTVHVTSEGDNYLVEGGRCARTVIRSFLRGNLQGVCANVIPRVHTPSGYPLTLGQATPATLVSGPDPGERTRRLATVAAEAFADAVARWIYSSGKRGPGLRGGSFTVDDNLKFTLRGVRFVSDAPVRGTGTWNPATGAAEATLEGITVRWRQSTPLATATIGESVLSLAAP
jgi:pimeloyl-ACP methyl ester carboxylesterase